MTKKPVLLESAMGREAPASSSNVVPMPEPASHAGKAAKIEKLTVYVPRAAAKRLRQMALDHDRRVNDYLQEAVDMMLAKYGQKSLREFEES